VAGAKWRELELVRQRRLGHPTRWDSPHRFKACGAQLVDMA
jgi:hypothetical protein